MTCYCLYVKQIHKAYEFQMPWIGDAGKQDIDLPHGENALETATDDVLDRERPRLVDLSPGW